MISFYLFQQFYWSLYHYNIILILFCCQNNLVFHNDHHSVIKFLLRNIVWYSCLCLISSLVSPNFISFTWTTFSSFSSSPLIFLFQSLFQFLNFRILYSLISVAIVRSASECVELVSQKMGGKVLQKRDLVVFDDSNTEVRLTLWGEKGDNTAHFIYSIPSGYCPADSFEFRWVSLTILFSAYYIVTYIRQIFCY